MADNVTVDNVDLTDYVVSSDEAASGQVQRVKLAYSADGSDVHVPADAKGLGVSAYRGTTPTVSTVADTASSTTLIASNANRVAVVISNDSSARLYVLYGSGTASATNYTFSLAQHEAANVDDYSGQINGIWASDPNDGAARITEVV